MARLRAARMPAAVLLGWAAGGSAGLFDWATGTSDTARCLVVSPTGGLLPDRWLSNGERRAGLRYGYLNGLPLTMRRAGRDYGRVDTLDRTYDLRSRVGAGELTLGYRLVETHAQWQQDRSPTAADWRETAWRTTLDHPVGSRWRVLAGFEAEDHRLGVVSAEPGLRPASSGRFDVHCTRHLAWAGGGVRTGTMTAALAAGWLGGEGDAATELRDLPADVTLKLGGWQGAASVGCDFGPNWELQLAGGYRDLRSRDTVRLDGVQHGRAWPHASEWQLGLEATGQVAPGVEWWGTLFCRQVDTGLAGNATALAPPLGALTGPRYRLESEVRLRQTGLASTVTWQATGRTTVQAGVRASVGGCTGRYVAYQKTGSSSEASPSGSALDLGVTIAFAGLSLEQRIGTLVVGGRLYAPYVSTRDNLAVPGPAAEPIEYRPAVPFALWVGSQW